MILEGEMTFGRWRPRVWNGLDEGQLGRQVRGLVEQLLNGPEYLGL